MSRIFTDEQARNWGRCPICHMHPTKQGHTDDCPRNKRKAK